jgi:transposase
VQAKIVEALAAGNYFNVACEVAGIGERTGYRWLEQGEQERSGPYQQFWQAVKKAEADAEASALQVVRDAMPQQWQAAMTFLERKFPARWARRERLDARHDLSWPRGSGCVMRRQSVVPCRQLRVRERHRICPHWRRRRTTRGRVSCRSRWSREE